MQTKKSLKPYDAESDGRAEAAGPAAGGESGGQPGGTATCEPSALIQWQSALRTVDTIPIRDVER